MLKERDVRREDATCPEQSREPGMRFAMGEGPGHNGAAPAEAELSGVRVGGKVSQPRNVAFGCFSPQSFLLPNNQRFLFSG